MFDGGPKGPVVASCLLDSRPADPGAKGRPVGFLVPRRAHSKGDAPRGERRVRARSQDRGWVPVPTMGGVAAAMAGDRRRAVALPIPPGGCRPMPKALIAISLPLAILARKRGPESRRRPQFAPYLSAAVARCAAQGMQGLTVMNGNNAPAVWGRPKIRGRLKESAVAGWPACAWGTVAHWWVR